MVSVLSSTLLNPLIPSTSFPKKQTNGKAKRRKKKGRHTNNHSQNEDSLVSDALPSVNNEIEMSLQHENIDIEYVPEDFLPEMELFFKSVVERFQAPSPSDIDFDLPSHGSDSDSESLPFPSESTENHAINNEKQKNENDTEIGKEKIQKEEKEANHNELEEEVTTSKRKLRKERRLTVSELKQLAEKPEVVEWVDVCAADPILLVDLKSTRNTVPIPVHWSQKRKYLQNKRGIEKPPFELPEFIRATGIQTLRELSEKPDATLKQKTRERVQPKTGKLVIDYAKLHDAFFKWQTKPEMTGYGEMYYEGREYETKLKNVRPGAPLSEELKEALNMPPLAPPPWLINMQRFGPPPSYPGLKIPGLNAPIPHEAQWGFHPGGWGKPPVDEYGRPLYGDVFGTSYDPHYLHPYAVSMEKELWGELPPEVDDDMGEEGMDEDDEAGDEGDEDDMDLDMNEEEEENEEEDEDEDTKERNRNMKDTVMDGKGPSEGMLEIAELTVVNQGHFTAAQKKGFYDQSKQKERQVDEEEGDEEMEIEEFVAGLETPAIPTDIELRKTQTTKPTQPTLLEPSSAFPPPSLYTILPEKKVSVSGMMGSERIYDMRAAQQKPELPTSTTEPTSSTPSMSSSSTPSTLHGNKDDKKKKLEEKKKKEFKF